MPFFFELRSKQTPVLCILFCCCGACHVFFFFSVHMFSSMSVFFVLHRRSEYIGKTVTASGRSFIAQDMSESTHRSRIEAHHRPPKVIEGLFGRERDTWGKNSSAWKSPSQRPGDAGSGVPRPCRCFAERDEVEQSPLVNLSKPRFHHAAAVIRNCRLSN